MHGSINVDRQMSRTKYPNSTHCAQIITLQPLRMLRYVIFVLNAIGLALWALTFFEFICANVAKLARKRYLVHDICRGNFIWIWIQPIVPKLSHCSRWECYVMWYLFWMQLDWPCELWHFSNSFAQMLQSLHAKDIWSMTSASQH